MMGNRIAIIGTGISGLGAAWRLHADNDITVYESADRLGGHSNTVKVDTPLGETSVDTGFIVYNNETYPNLSRLFASLGVATEPSDMSFSYSVDGTFEYGASVRGVLAQPSNLASRRFRRMLLDINRFRKSGRSLIPKSDEPIGDLLVRNGYSDGFTFDYLYPMTGAIWSSPTADIAHYPAAPLLRFMANHGLIDVIGRPRWRTVSGGSKNYVQLLSAPFIDRIRTESPVSRILRMSNEVLVESNGRVDTFDHVVVATHSDQALAIMGTDASDRERSLLGDIRYQANRAVLHSDARLMPRRTATWSSWNAMRDNTERAESRVSLTYWMNRLQNLDDRYPLFVTLNPSIEPREQLVHARFDYSHPLFDTKAISAQRGLAEIQGINRTWFAGAYLGYGFHEDGLQSGFNVSAALGSPAPWSDSFQPISSALPPKSLAQQR